MHLHVRGIADGFCISSTEPYSPTTLFPLYLGIHIPSCLFSITNPIFFFCVYKAKMHRAFGDAYTLSSQLSNPLSAKQVLFLPHALKETASPSYGFQESSHNISNMRTIIMTSLSVSLSWEQLYFSCISCAVIRPESLNVADAEEKKKAVKTQFLPSFLAFIAKPLGRGALTKKSVIVVREASSL